MFFGLFDSAEKKMRDAASNWLELATKVYDYRRDQLSDAESTELQQAAIELRRQLKEKKDACQLKLGIETLEGVLRRTGGTHYPKSGMMENVEFFLVAAIVILGVRMYFVQPFKIPTNSMWPSYNGMTPEVFPTKADEPSLLAKAVRFAAIGAHSRTVDAPIDGEVYIPLSMGERAVIPFREVAGRDWLILPARFKEYTLMVNDRPVTVTVPRDFDFEWVIRDAFIAKQSSGHDPGGVDLIHYLQSTPNQLVRLPDGRIYWRTGKKVRAGDRVLAFDILTGDQLFVDRVSYHFVKPKPGDGFVFRTDHIASQYMQDASGHQIEQYYIKRLAGTPGDLLEIRDFTLYRNGQPATGSKAYDANAKRTGNYSGYRPLELLAPGKAYTVPENGYIALGDNSANSLDSRYWGPVPSQDVVGRPLFIYYPFTPRWGVAP